MLQLKLLLFRFVPALSFLSLDDRPYVLKVALDEPNARVQLSELQRDFGVFRIHQRVFKGLHVFFVFLYELLVPGRA